MNLVNFISFYIFSMLIGLIPFRLIYAFSNFLAFILKKAGYRKHVIISNLDSSFPDLTKTEKERIIKKFYLNLSDVILEGIKAFTMTRKQVLSRYHILNAELLNPYLERGQSVICVTGHYGNWEWGALEPPLQIPCDFVAFYKPLKNKLLDRFVRKNRSRYGTYLAPIRETTKTFDEYHDRTAIYLMAADQSPSNRELSYWIVFFGRDTAFLHGPEKHARNNDYPVVFVAIRRIKRGFYNLELSILAEGPASLPDGEITKRYAAKMESLIREDPANWLWSHKRWKLTR